MPVEVAPFSYGGLDYGVAGGQVDLELTAARVSGSLTLTAELETHVLGPCQRCLVEAQVPVVARGVDYVHHGDSEGDDDDPDGYAEAYRLDVERWVRDLIAEALPSKLLCDDECRGLCSICGVSFNEDPNHNHTEA